MEHIDSTIKTVTKSINDNTTAEIEYSYNQNVRTKTDGIYLINQIDKIIVSDRISQSLLGWYHLWLVSINYFIGNYDEAKKSLNICNNLPLNDEQNKLKDKFTVMFGFHEFYNDWNIFETENIIFHYRKDENSKTDIDAFILSRENAFIKIQNFFNSKLHRKIDFYLWDSREEAFSVLNRHLGFAIGWYYLIHNAADQSIGHEITHIITHYINGAKSISSLICEGAAVLFDQSSGRDNIKFAKLMMEKNNVTAVDIKALWENFFILSSGITYSTAVVFAQNLLNKFGKEKYIEIIKTQTYDEVCSILGKNNLEFVIEETQEMINNA